MEEEIRIITEAVSGLSGTALSAFVWYLVAAKLIPVIVGWGGGIALACILIKGIGRIIATCLRTDNIVRQLRNGLDMGSSGSLYGSEITQVANIIPALIEAYKKETQK